jgi:hypothetical protein
MPAFEQQPCCWNWKDPVRIPSDADQRSELMAITIPNSCRSPFQSDGDHRSKPMPITRPLG